MKNKDIIHILNEVVGLLYTVADMKYTVEDLDNMIIQRTGLTKEIAKKIKLDYIFEQED